MEPTMSEEDSTKPQVTCLAIGDPHYKTSNLRYAKQMENKIWELLEERNPTFIVILGDTLHRHEKLNVYPHKMATDFIEHLSADYPVYLLIGNHDRPDNDHYLTDIHPFNCLKNYSTGNINVVDIGLTDTIYGKKCLFIPYVPKGRFDDVIKSLDLDPDDLKDVDMIFAHQEFRGAKNGGVISEDGDVWPLCRPPVISGHIHEFDKLQHNITYTGTPFQHSFGDRPDKSVSFITFNDSGYEHERVYLDLPKRKSIRMSPKDATTFTPPIVDDPSLIRIIITGTRGEIRALIKTGFTEAWSKSGFKVDFKYLKTDDTIVIPLKRDGDILTQLSAMNVTTSYRSALLTEISKHPEQLVWFNELFGTA